MIENARIFSDIVTIKAPLVSIVIPVYNVKHYLPQCLDSVILQTYPNIEILIIDDGSTDGSGYICDQYAEKDQRIQVIHSQNKGLASARNLGLDNTRGEYISFIDSDDWMELYTIETLLRAAAETDADLVTAGICSEYLGKTVYRKRKIDFAQTYHGQEILEAFVEGVFGHVAWNKLYRSEYINEYRFPVGHNYEDVFITWKLMKKLAENGAVVTALPDVLFHFRKRRSSITHTWTFSNTHDRWKAYHALYEALPDYQGKLLPGCFMAIGKMWMTYSGYSKEEKANAKATARQMHAFSRENFHRVMRAEYTSFVKISCLLSQGKSTLVMWIGYNGGRLWRAFREKKYPLYD